MKSIEVIKAFLATLPDGKVAWLQNEPTDCLRAITNRTNPELIYDRIPEKYRNSVVGIIWDKQESHCYLHFDAEGLNQQWEEDYKKYCADAFDLCSKHGCD